MSKAIKWQIPFVSTIDKIRYRIDIYAEGYSGDPIQLTGGTTPIKTEEDKSDDFFAPVRGQTGTIEVVTKLPNGGTLDINDLLPANNIDHPVRLVSISGSTDTVEWQGFMSCEAFSQNYTSVPDTFSFPIISVLEAMDSVQLDQSRLTGLQRIDYCLQTILLEIAIKSGIQCFTYVNYSRTDFNILQKYIDTMVMYDQKEYNHENTTSYIVSGKSAKEALERICKYMGWIAREEKTEIHLQRIGEDRGAYRAPIDNFNQTQTKYITTRDIATEFADKWRGIDHKRSISQGAKSVEVVAKLEKYQLNISLPEFPVGNTTEVYRQLWRYNEHGDWLYLIVNWNMNAYSNISFSLYSANVRYSFSHFENYATTTLAALLSHMSVGEYSSAKMTIQSDTTTLVKWYAGSFLCKYCWETSGSIPAHDTKNALYCAFFPHAINYISDDGSDFNPSSVGPIFSINNILDYRCDSGYLRLNAETDTVFMWQSSNYTGLELKHSDEQANDWYIAMELQFGNKWWNGASWQTAQCIFNVTMRKNNFKKNWNSSMQITEVDGHLIPISSEMRGNITLKIWPMASCTSYDSSNGVIEMIFSSLSVEHLLPDNDALTDRSENHYFRLLGTNFSDDISINTELASSLNNQPSPSLIMNDETNPMTTLDYFVGTGTVSRRPEVDLLDRLAQYYSAARQRLELVLAHPTAAPLPLLRLNGISHDTRQYTPLAESRDWINDTSTLTCFETPNNE